MEANATYELDYTEGFLRDLAEHKKSGQKKLIEKIDAFLDELEVHPTTGIGQVEALKGYGVRSVYSRRIDKKHRLIYEIFEEEKRIEIISAYGHYKD